MNTQKFEFVNYDVDVEIAGQKFTFDCSSETGDYLKECSSELMNLAKQIEAGEKTVEDAIQYGVSMVDRLLGEGAAEKLFSGRKKRLSDITDLCVWLTEVATKFQNERIKVHQNRAQRRAAASV